MGIELWTRRLGDDDLDDDGQMFLNNWSVMEEQAWIINILLRLREEKHFHDKIMCEVTGGDYFKLRI